MIIYNSNCNCFHSCYLSVNCSMYGLWLEIASDKMRGGGLKEINGVTIVVLSVYVKSSDKEH